MPPSGSRKPLLYIVGMAPGVQEDIKGRQFVGDSGKKLRRALDKVGVNMDCVRFYNAVNCLPPNNEILPTELEICSHRVRDDIKHYRPPVIVALGNEACQALWPRLYSDRKSITKTRGSKVPYDVGDGVWSTVLPTYHPSYILRGVFPEVETAWLNDLAEAWELATRFADGHKMPVELNAEAGHYREPSETIYCLKGSSVREFFAELKDQPIVAFDWETTDLHPWPRKFRPEVDPKLYSGAWAFEDGRCFALPLHKTFWSESALGTIMEGLALWFTERCPTQVRIAHNLKFELLWAIVRIIAPHFKQHPMDVRLVGHYEDTMLLEWLNDERQGASRLKSAAWTQLGKPDWSVDVKNILTLPFKDVLKYNALDSWYTLRLFQYRNEQLIGEAQADAEFPWQNFIYNEVLIPACLSFVKTELDGCPIDEDRRLKFKTEYDARIIEIKATIAHESGKPNLNPDSPVQLSKYFYDDCGYRPLKRTKQGGSTDDESLDFLIAEHGDKVAKVIQELRGVSKLNSTYITGLEEYIYADGCLHSSYALNLTVTGRTSSSDPNQQNFPVRNNKEVREIIIPPPGMRLVSFDYGQIEARLFGVVTKDPDFIDALFNDYDIHLENARILFGDAKAKEMRPPVKNGTFAMFYGGGDKKVADTCGVSVEEIAHLRQLIFGKFRRIIPWQKQIEEFEQSNGYVESLFFRRRRSPMSYNERLNHPIQSTASDMTLVSKVWLNNLYRTAMMIHDDLTFWLPEQGLEEAIEHIAECMLCIPWFYMQHSEQLRAWVPLQVEASIGMPSWGQKEEVLKTNSMQFGIKTLKDSVSRAEQLMATLSKQIGKDNRFQLNLRG